MEDNGYTVKIENVPDLMAVKNQYKVPAELQSCHTAIVDGYVIEGHVPAAEVGRLLTERPEVAGLAVPGMPIGSPGMEVDGAEAQPFQVFAFGPSAEIGVFASYNQ